MILSVENILIVVAGYILGAAILLSHFEPEDGGWKLAIVWTMLWMGICIKWVF